MSVRQQNELNPTEHLLLWAFAISLMLHLLAYGGFKLGNHYHWWDKSLLPSWLKSTKATLAQIQKNAPKPPPVKKEIEMTFLEVDPTVATADAPKDAKYYAARNSIAANKEAQQETEAPKITGNQTHVAKTETAPRVKAIPLQPSAPKNNQPEENRPEAKARPSGGKPIGDLALAKPLDKNSEKPGDAQVQPDSGEAPTPIHHRPRTLVEARAQQQALAGDKMRQDGGVKRHMTLDSLDARATGFGEYDDQLIRAIQNHWYDLLDREQFSRDATGKVTIQFHLKYDGTVDDVNIIQNGVGDILGYVCRRAITDPAPYTPWPSDMRRVIGAEYREVRFTFYYE